MRAEEKELEGPDLEREQTKEDERESEQEELPELSQDMADLQLDHRSRLFDALQLILAGEQVNLTLLYLPQRATHALEALQTAVHGSDSVGEFVFAEDRRVLLEQALAVLQQNLTHGEPAQLAELQSKFDSMTQHVGELREQLSNLEDAQEERDEFHNAARVKLGATDDKADDEEPAPKEDPGLVDFIAEALYAMAEIAPTKSSTLAGEERPREVKPSSLMHGPEVKDAPRPKSSLYDDSDLRDANASETHDPSPQRRKVVPKPEPEKKR